MERYTIKYRGVELDVEGIYQEGEYGTYETPGYPEHFDIEAIYADTQDIFELLTSDQIDEIEVKVLDKI
jgi:hypothetical protein